MKFLSCTFLILVSLFSSHIGRTYELLPGLVVNYSNFSYVSSVSVGFKYVYFGTTHGVTRYDIGQKRWDDPLTGIEGLGNIEIYDIMASRDDERIWVRTDLGIFEYIDVFGRWDQINQMPDEIVNGRHLRPDFNYYPPPGYDYFNTGVLADQYNNRFPLTDIVDDGWSNLWIGTWGLGALKANVSARQMELLNFGLLQEDITEIYSDDGILWIGGNDTGFTRVGFTVFDWREYNFEFVETLPGLNSYAANVNDIKANDNDIFVGTDEGLLIIDKVSKEVTEHLYRKSGLPDDRIISLLATGDTLFIGTEYGLGILNIYGDSTDLSLKTILPSHSILSLDKIDNHIWVGTNRGTYRFNPYSGKLGHLKVPEVSGFGEIRDIEHTEKKVWISIDYELRSIDRNTAYIETYPEVIKYGGPRAIAVQDTVIAAATNSGLLLIFDGERKHHYLYTVNDGLISNDIRDLIFDGEYIWLGTDRGLSRFWYQHPSLYF